MAGNALASAVVTLCNCSAANGAEYFSSQAINMEYIKTACS